MKKFECPLSPHIKWYSGMTYSECPLIATERDMGACQNCHLRGEANVAKSKKQQRRAKDQEEVREKRNNRKKEGVPNIKGTYVGE